MLFLGFVGASLPFWTLQPRVLLSPLIPLMPSLPTSFPATLSALDISWASHVPSFCCWYRFELRHIPLLPSYPECQPPRYSVDKPRPSYQSEVPLFTWSFSITLGGVDHFDPGNSSPYSAQIFLYAMLPTWLWSSKYASPGYILQPDVICCTVWGASLQSLPLGFCLVW